MTCEDLTEREASEAERYAIPAYVRTQFCAQRRTAKARGVPFAFTLAQWSIWWAVELARLGPEAKRGRRRGEWVMARIDGKGAIEAGNVECVRAEAATCPDPQRRGEAMRRVWAARKAAGGVCHLARRGEAHPRSKPLATPLGRFVSVTEAAAAYGISRQAGARRAALGLRGWRYVERGSDDQGRMDGGAGGACVLGLAASHVFTAAGRGSAQA